MQNNSDKSTETPQSVGAYQRVATVVVLEEANTSVEQRQLRTVSTTKTEGEITLRYTPREQRQSDKSTL